MMTTPDAKAKRLQEIALKAVNGELPEIAEWLREIDEMWREAMPIATDEVKRTRMIE